VREYRLLVAAGLVFVQLSDKHDNGFAGVIDKLCKDRLIVPGFTIKVRTPAEMVVENAFDENHFGPVHGISVSGAFGARPSESGELAVDAVVNSAGLGAQALARRTEDYPQDRVPRLVLARGNYFGYAGRPVFSRLVYPAPRIDGGLGTHVTLDLAGRMRFGPDVEWIDEENYNVNPERAKSFYASIRRYWPALPDNSLQPDYAGVRPKLTGPGEPAADFMIEGPAHHGLPGLVHMFGIESPGLTSSLSLADEVVTQLDAGSISA